MNGGRRKDGGGKGGEGVTNVEKLTSEGKAVQPELFTFKEVVEAVVAV